MALKVALIGNPNVGKTVFFNALTGGRAHVGNWPGKTVEKKEGKCIYKEVEINIIDLPGIYSLTANSIDELIARDFIIEEKPDVVIDIVDASNLERNLYLTLQLIDLEANLVVALNKYDIAEGLGYEIDVDELSKLLGVPVIPTIATTKEGLKELVEVVVKITQEKEKRRMVGYGEEIEELISRLEEVIVRDEELSSRYPARWLAIKILEGDEEVLMKVKGSKCKDEVLEVLS